MANGRRRSADSAIDPSLLQLPPGYESTFDPVEGNPFPHGTVRHGLWHKATQKAEEQIARLKSEWLQVQETLAEPRTLDEMVAWNQTHQARNRARIASEFQVWAARAAHVLFTDADVRYAETWLVGYANACLETNAALMQKYGLPTHLAEPDLRETRNVLARLVLHWKAEYRRCRSLREEQAQTSEPAAPTAERAAEPSGAALSRTPQSPALRFPKRAEWLERALAARTWTVQDLQRNGGPDVKTIRKVLAGKYVREVVLERLVQGLSFEGKVRLSEVPSE